MRVSSANISALHFLDLTLPSVAENLALDEALLLDAEGSGTELLRLWESPHYAVILGAGCRIDEVDEAACKIEEVAVYRRSSGGGTVVIGPGCLCYSLVLSYGRDSMLGDIRSSFRWILQRIVAALSASALRVDGISDLVLGQRKVSGNAQQRKRMHLLHHGTLLYDFDIARVGRVLHLPDRQPEYRRHRSHIDFLTNLPYDRAELSRRLCEAWQIADELTNWPRETVDELARTKYEREDWTHRR